MELRCDIIASLAFSLTVTITHTPHIDQRIGANPMSTACLVELLIFSALKT